jgi:hypothetical protein
MVKLVEITINQEQRTFDRLKNIISDEVEIMHERLRIKSVDFTVPAAEVFSPDILEIEISDIVALHAKIISIYTNQEQTYQITEYLYRYLSNSISY